MREVTATILENVRIAENIYSLTFATEEEIEVRPGQFCMVGVQNFPLRRPIAVCKAEGERITVCYQLKGAGTHTLAENYKQGEKLSVLLPLGNGFYVKDEEKRIAKSASPSWAGAWASSRSSPPSAPMRARRKSTPTWALRTARRTASLTNCSGATASSSRRTTAAWAFTALPCAFMAEIDDVKPDVVLSCGPAPMLRALKKATAGRNIPTFVSLEERMGCGIGACLVCVCEKTDGAHARVCKDGPVFDINEVNL